MDALIHSSRRGSARRFRPEATPARDRRAAISGAQASRGGNRRARPGRPRLAHLRCFSGRRCPIDPGRPSRQRRNPVRHHLSFRSALDRSAAVQGLHPLRAAARHGHSAWARHVRGCRRPPDRLASLATSRDAASGRPNEYRFEVRGADGTAHTSTSTVTYIDGGLPWQTQSEGLVDIWWYAGGEDLATDA